MSAAHKNESPVSAGQFVKTLSEYAGDFNHKSMQVLHNDANFNVDSRTTSRLVPIAERL